MTLMWKEINEQPEVLERCIKENAGTISALSEEIKKRGISWACMAARGTSLNAAIYGKYALEVLTGIPAGVAAPSVLTVYGKKPRYKDCLVIGVSQSGMAGDVLEVLREAKGQGALTVAITNSTSSPMASEAMYHLWCAAGEEKSVPATKTYTAQMMLLAQLAAELAGSREEKERLSAVPGVAAKVLADTEAVEKAADTYKDMRECVVLARGFCYPVARETALKIQETSYVRALAFSASQFKHGPVALVEKGTPAIALVPEGPTSGEMKDLLDRLNRLGADILAFTNDRDAAGKARRSVMVPESESELAAPFYIAPKIQMFACQLTLKKGLCPDTPRELSKVTVTR